SEQRMPLDDTAAGTDTPIWRLVRSMTLSLWTKGTTKTLAPMTTFWPEVSLAPALPLRPVMMNASLGPATRMRLMTKTTISATRARPPSTATTTGDGSNTAPLGDGRDRSAPQASSAWASWSSNGATLPSVGDTTSTTNTPVPTGGREAARQAAFTGRVGRSRITAP